MHATILFQLRQNLERLYAQPIPINRVTDQLVLRPAMEDEGRPDDDRRRVETADHLWPVARSPHGQCLVGQHVDRVRPMRSAMPG